MEVPDNLGTQEVVIRAKESVKERGEGRFFRYISTDSLAKLLSEGEITYDGKREFLTVTDKKFNSHELPFENYIAYATLEIVDTFFDETEGLRGEKLIALEEDAWAPIEKVEALLCEKDQSFGGLKQSVKETCETQSILPLMVYFKRVGGEELMIRLKRMGYPGIAYGSFSDLIPVSVGAPLGVPASEKVVAVELDFENSEIVIPKKDYLNEHEVMVRRIRADDLRGIYTHEDRELLWERVSKKHPDYFTAERGLVSYGDFAREKPLTELLQEYEVVDVI